MIDKYDKFLDSLHNSSGFLKNHLGSCVIRYFLNFISCKPD